MFKVENSYYDDTLVLVKTNSYQKTVEYQFNNSQSKKVKYADNTAYGNAVNEVGKKFVEVKKDVWYKIDSVVQVRKNALSLVFLVNGLGTITKTYANSTALNAEISKLDPYFISIDEVYYKGTTLHVASVDAQTLSIHFQFDNGDEKVETYANSTALNAALAKLAELGGGGSESEISDNTASTIDVSTYNDPVEITPGEGYDATKKVTVTLSNIPSGGSDVPSVMALGTYDSDAVILFGDKTKLTRLFAYDIVSNSGWIDDISQTFNSSILGGNGLLVPQNKLTDNLPALCVEYNNKMYKAPASVSNNCEKYDFTEVQSQATPPTSDTPSGAIASGTIVHLSTTETSGTIYYSTDSGAFEEYDDSRGIEIRSDTTVQAVVAVDGKFTSEYLELTFTLE